MEMRANETALDIYFSPAIHLHLVSLPCPAERWRAARIAATISALISYGKLPRGALTGEVDDPAKAQ